MTAQTRRNIIRDGWKRGTHVESRFIIHHDHTDMVLIRCVEYAASFVVYIRDRHSAQAQVCNTKNAARAAMTLAQNRTAVAPIHTVGEMIYDRVAIN